MTALIILILAFMVAGWVQGLVGFGFAVATTLLLVNRMDFTTLVFLNLAMSLVTAIIAMLSAKNLKAINRPALLKIIVSAAAGLGIGIILINRIDAIILKKVTLAVILIASLLSLRNNKSFFAHSWMAWAGGFFSGVLTPSTGINGPLVALHLNAAFKDKQQIRTTMLAYLFLIMAFGVISMSLQNSFSTKTWGTLAKVVVPSVIGYIAGLQSFKLLSDSVFKKTVTGFLICSSLASLIYLIF